MSRGRTRITALEPEPIHAVDANGVVHGNYVPTVTSFRSNVVDDHYVVSLSEEDREDGSPMGYVNRRAATDLACHFVAIANDLGATLRITADLTE